MFSGSLQGILQSRNCNIGDTKVCDVQLVPEGTKDIENISNLLVFDIKCSFTFV